MNTYGFWLVLVCDKCGGLLKPFYSVFDNVPFIAKDPVRLEWWSNDYMKDADTPRSCTCSPICNWETVPEKDTRG